MPRLLWLIILLLLATSAQGTATEPVVVFAGSASQPPLEEAADVFKAKTGVPVILHLGGSGAMLNQARLTGIGDVYIPGSPDYLEKAIEFKLTAGSPINVAYLIPAILVAQGNPLGIQGLNDLERTNLRIGLADPDGVCVGLYAIELLETNALLKKVRPNLNGMVESCAKAAAMIQLKQVDVVLGWREFESWNSSAMDAIIPKPDQIPRLAYIPAIELKGAKNSSGARDFINFLVSPQGQAIFHKWGYLTDREDARRYAPEARIGGVYNLPEGW